MRREGLEQSGKPDMYIRAYSRRCVHNRRRKGKAQREQNNINGKNESQK